MAMNQRRRQAGDNNDQRPTTASHYLRYYPIWSLQIVKQFVQKKSHSKQLSRNTGSALKSRSEYRVMLDQVVEKHGNALKSRK
ncbi:hypothetical protein Sjap_008232 [Stephania japonica]|uniref:Uncharacterized protein n=1 Tax=Stephania japonica TaxID=461633 RepID=A0AAP0JP39_9MAGN